MLSSDLQLLPLMKGLRSPTTCIEFNLLSSNSPVVKKSSFSSPNQVFIVSGHPSVMSNVHSTLNDPRIQENLKIGLSHA